MQQFPKCYYSNTMFVINVHQWLRDMCLFTTKYKGLHLNYVLCYLGYEWSIHHSAWCLCGAAQYHFAWVVIVGKLTLVFVSYCPLHSQHRIWKQIERILLIYELGVHCCIQCGHFFS